MPACKRGLYSVANRSLFQGLVSYWSLGDATGATRVDAYGTNNLANNGSGGGVSQTAGVTGASLASNFVAASSQYLLGASPFWLVYPITVATWVNPADSSAQYSLWGNSDTAGSNFSAAMITTTHKVQVTFDTTSHTINSSTSVSAGAWAFVVVTYDGTTANTYINGVLDVNSGALVNSGFTPTKALIGSRANGGSQIMNGKIGPTAVWSRLLTATEITAAYNGGVPLSFVQ